MYHRQVYLTLLALALATLILAHVARYTNTNTILGVGEAHLFNDTFVLLLAAAALALGKQAGF